MEQGQKIWNIIQTKNSGSQGQIPDADSVSGERYRNGRCRADADRYHQRESSTFRRIKK